MVISHRSISTNGINMHIAETGPDSGPVVLFLHGFPEFWYSWRHQMLAFSEAGYHAIAPDLRGYGETDAPQGVSKYSCIYIVGDLIGLLDALKLEKVLLVSHDWGATVGWQLCLFRPDCVIAHATLSVPYMPRNPSASQTQLLASSFGENHYVVQFQIPGKIEDMIAKMTAEGFFKVVFSGKITQDFNSLQFREDVSLPTWISEDDIVAYVDAFKKNGFTPPVNYYRALHLSWELTGPWTGSKVTVPSILIIGDKDIVYDYPGVKAFIHEGGLATFVPNLKDVILLKDVQHFLHEEKPDIINSHLLSFFKDFKCC